MKRFSSVCLALASVCAAGAVVGAARPQYGGTLRVETEAVVRALDPAVAAGDAAEAATRRRIAPLVFEGLVSVNERGLQPRLAATWEQEPRGGRWRFHLRPGVTLQDGTLLEAWQAAASLRASEPGWKVAAEGDTVVVDAGGAGSDLPWALADERHAIVIRSQSNPLVGTGPFRLERIEGTRVALRSHDGYWRGRPFVDAVQVEGGSSFETQLSDLEAGRADFVSIRATDARRAARRGVRLDASNPIELVAMVFEPHRVSDTSLQARRTLAASFNRDAICSVVLQGHGVPARAVLPAWLSGYASIVSADAQPLARSAVVALPADVRELSIRAEGGDPVLQAVAERLAVDAREAGFTMRVQPPTGLAPRPDARLVRIALTPTTPDRAFAQAAAQLVVRGWPAIALPDGLSIEAAIRAEHTLIDRAVVVPIVHLPELYALGERAGVWTRPAANATGGWNLADVWLRGRP
jgi:hypothetical protein